MSMQLTDSRDYLSNSVDGLTTRPKCSLRKFWDRRSRLEKNLLMLVAILLFLILVFVVVLIVVLTSKKDDADSVCVSDTCTKYAREVHSMLNTSVNPCDNFYDFACGSWRYANSVPPGRKYWSQDDAIFRRNLRRVDGILLNGQPEKSFESLQKAFNYYKSCTNLEARNEQGYKRVKEILSNIGGWPLIDSSWTHQNYKWEDAIVFLNQNFPKISYILNFEINLNQTTTDTSSIYISPALISVDKREYLKENSIIIVELKRFIKDVATLVGGEESLPKNADDEIDLMVKFERDLVNASEAFKINDPKNGKHQAVSFRKLHEDQTINWLNIFKRIFNDSLLNEDDQVYVRHVGYFTAVGKLISNLPSRTLANYIGWKTTHLLAAYSALPLVNRTTVYDKEQKAMPLVSVGELCLSSVKIEFKHALAYRYIEMFIDKRAVNEAHQIFNAIRDSLISRINSDEAWSKEESEILATKLKNLQAVIGYPFWLKSEAALEEYYSNLGQIKDSDYFGNYLVISRWETERQLSSLRGTIKYGEWPIEVYELNAIYVRYLNQIIFPLAFLEYPYYSHDLPQSVTYGRLGAVFAHEMTHTIGIPEDPNKNKFLRHKVNCFIAQYDKYYDWDINITMKGLSMLSENLADNHGLLESYTAFKKQEGTKKNCLTLPAPMRNFNRKQLFFVAFATSLCSKYHVGYDTRGYSTARFRVDGAVSNSKGFARAFNCGANATMNPPVKCVL